MHQFILTLGNLQGHVLLALTILALKIVHPSSLARPSCAATLVSPEQQCTGDCCSSCRFALEMISECLNFQIFLGGGGACPQTPSWAAICKFDPPKMKLLPTPMFRLVLFLTTTLSLIYTYLVQLRCDAIRTSVTPEVVLPSTFSNFQSHT